MGLPAFQTGRGKQSSNRATVLHAQNHMFKLPISEQFEHVACTASDPKGTFPASFRPGEARVSPFPQHQTGGRPRTARETMETRKRTRNTTNRICAIDDAVPATPLNPRAAAISATIRNVSAQPSMAFSFHDLTTLHERNAKGHVWFQNDGGILQNRNQCIAANIRMLRSCASGMPFQDMGNLRNLRMAQSASLAMATSSTACTRACSGLASSFKRNALRLGPRSCRLFPPSA